MRKVIHKVLFAFLSTAIVLHALPIETSDGDPYISPSNSSILQRDDDPDLGTLTSLFGYQGCSQQDKKMVNQAFADAIDIAASVAPKVDDIDNMDPFQYVNHVWWGKFDHVNNKDKIHWGEIKEPENLKRMRELKDHWKLGDLLGARWFEIRCRNDHDLPNSKGNGCVNGKAIDPSAHVVSKHDNGNAYDTICLCDDWFDSHISFKEKVQRMDDPKSPYPRNNLLSLKTQGSIFLHEMLHTKYHHLENIAGLTDPVGVDIELTDTAYKGRAYDPAKAKFIATYIIGGMEMTGRNVDNYVYFALWHYVKNRWGVQAWEPPRSWRTGPGGMTQGYPDFAEGITSLPQDYYVASVSQTMVETGGFVDYGGKPCTADSDCDGTCPPDFKATCDVKSDKLCKCGFTFDPS